MSDTKRSYSSETPHSCKSYKLRDRNYHEDTSSLYETPRTYRSNRSKVPPIELKLEDDNGTIDPINISPIATDRSLLPMTPVSQTKRNHKIVRNKRQSDKQRDKHQKPNVPSPPHTPARRSQPIEINNAASSNDRELRVFNCEYIRADERGIEMIIAPRKTTKIAYQNGNFTFSVQSS